jgi:ribosomal subunit interface protein
MLLPLQCTFRGMSHSDALEAHVRRRAAKLDRFFGRIGHCHVVIEVSHRHRQGNRFRVSIDMTVTHRHELAIARAPTQNEFLEDAHAAVERAFDEAERRLDDWEQRLRGYVKSHRTPPLARVARVFGDRGFGFLENEEGEEIYFHRNSVLREAFAALAPGVLVRYHEELGDYGPQASTVEIVA